MTNRDEETPPRLGLMLVLSSPSGAGKTTMTRRLLAADEGVRLSVSATTRAIRPGEKDGRDYHFVDRARFDRMVAAGAFLEWAEVFGHRYGTPKAAAQQLLRQGKDVVFDIDWQGARQLRGGDVAGELVSIFLLPPGMRALEQRLRARGGDSEEAITRRMGQAQAEIDHFNEYDFVVVNDDPDRCLAAIRTILAAERLRLARNPAIRAFAERLLAEKA